MNQWLQITAGRGPAECCWVVYKVVQRIIKEAGKYDLKAEVLESISGDHPQTFKSALLALDGEQADLFCNSWDGTIQWIGKSPFRPHHKRKNWFVAVNLFRPPREHYFNQKDIKIETMRSSGPGGQHVNKTESA
ncbi:peptide chain release factor H, partial [bacterium]|nr:peptide chain release factor H [bacterium]